MVELLKDVLEISAALQYRSLFLYVHFVLFFVFFFEGCAAEVLTIVMLSTGMNIYI